MARPGQLQVKDRRVAKIIRACQDLPGQQLFQYFDDAGEPQDITSSAVDAYLRDITGSDMTAKDSHLGRDGTRRLALREFEAIDHGAKTKKLGLAQKPRSQTRARRASK